MTLVTGSFSTMDTDIARTSLASCTTLLIGAKLGGCVHWLCTCLHKHTMPPDVPFFQALLTFSPVSGELPETEHLIGFFVNVLALHIKIQKNMNFQEVLQDVRKTVLDAYAHQEIPFEMVIDQVTLTREDLNIPLIRVLFVLQNFSTDAREKLPGITIESLRSEKPLARFDLTLFLQEGPEGIGGSVVYRTALFREQTIASLVRRLQLLLESAVARPDIPVEKIEMLTVEEKAEQKNEKEERSRDALMLLRRRKRKAIDASELSSEISERRSR